MRALRQTLRALPASVWALFAGTLINRFGSFVLVFLVLYLTRLGYSVAEAGAAVSVYGVGSVAAATAGGHLADRLGRRNAIALSMFSAAAAMLALSQARALWVVIVLTGVAGFTAEMYRPAVAGFLAERSFFWLFVGDAIKSIIYGIVALVMLPHGVRSQAAEEKGSAGAIATILADGRLVRLLVGATVIAFVFNQAFSTFPLQVQAHGHSAAAYGALMSLNGLLIVFLELPLTTITQRYPPGSVIALGFLLTGAGLGLTGVAGAFPLLALTVALWTFGEMFSSPVLAAHVADLAPTHMRGRYQAALALSYSVGLIVAPTLGAMLYSWSPMWLWVICAAIGALAAALGGLNLR